MEDWEDDSSVEGEEPEAPLEVPHEKKEEEDMEKDDDEEFEKEDEVDEKDSDDDVEETAEQLHVVEMDTPPLTKAQEDALNSFFSDLPVSELKETVGDIKALFEREDIVDVAGPWLVNFYADHFLPVTEESSGDKLVVSKYGKLGDYFYDPKCQKRFAIDPIRKIAKDVSAYSVPVELNEQREELQDLANTYVQTHLPSDGVGAVFPVDENELVVCFSSQKYQERSLWSGSWHSEWHFDFSHSPEVRVHGKCWCRLHVFESGNVQLSSDVSEKSTTIADGRLKKAVHWIEDQENAFHKAVDDMLADMGTQAFRALRRALPVTGTKFDFNLAFSKVAGSMKN